MFNESINKNSKFKIINNGVKNKFKYATGTRFINKTQNVI